MTNIIPFVRVTKKSIMRQGKKELLRAYQISAGGSDPIVNSKSWEDFEAGFIDEMPWIDFVSICYQMYMENE